MSVDVLDWRFAREVLKGGLLSVIMPVFRLADSIEANLASVAEYRSPCRKDKAVISEPARSVFNKRIDCCASEYKSQNTEGEILDVGYSLFNYVRCCQERKRQ